jgi:hypothetical protein
MRVLLVWEWALKLMAKHADGSFDYAKIEAQTRNALKIISSLR